MSAPASRRGARGSCGGRHRASTRPTAVYAVIAGTAQPAGAQAAASNPASLELVAATALLVAVLLAGALAALWRLLRQGWRHAARIGSLQAERDALGELVELAAGWTWRSDERHRLVSLHPASGDESAYGDRPLWEQFPEVGEPTLRSQLHAQALALAAVVVLQAGGASRRCLLHGRRIAGGDGFAGYMGTLRECAADAAAPPKALSADARRGPAPAPGAPVATPVAAPVAAPLAAPFAAPGATPSAAKATPDDADTKAYAYALSHDLRAPLRIVEGFAKILKEDYGGLLDRVGNGHLDRVLAAAERMNAMIDALLAMSRLAEQPLGAETVDLSRIAAEVAADLARHDPARVVRWSIEPGMVAVGDAALLRSVVENLLGNAWKYSSKRPEADIRFERHASVAGAFTVHDNGAGFDMRHAERLFGLFQRLHGASDFEGSGVGLASVRRIVRRHGGEVWAEGEPGRGASFHFSLGTR